MGEEKERICALVGGGDTGMSGEKVPACVLRARLQGRRVPADTPPVRLIYADEFARAR